MNQTIAFVLILAGIAIAIYGFFGGFLKALSDPEVDKVSMLFGLYFSKYPKYLICFFGGLILVFVTAWIYTA